MPAISPGDLALLRTHPHKVKEYLAVMQPATVLACQLNGTPSGDPIVQVNYHGVTEGSYENVVAGMTLWIGTSPRGKGKGMCRVRKAPTSSILYIAEDSIVDWADGDYLTVVENYELWVKYPRVQADGGLTIHKDWDISYSGQNRYWEPVAVLGPPETQFIDPYTEVAICEFVGDRSYAASPGATITGYSWSFPGGTPSSSTDPGTEGSPIEVTWDAPGIYWISLTVTDSNEKTHTGRRPVFIFNKVGEEGLPITRFKMTGRSGSLDRHGHNASFEVYGDADQEQFPDRALVVYWTEDWYGDTQKSIGGNFPYRAHVKFVGYIQEESTAKDPITSTVTFKAATIDSLMASREGFSCWLKTNSNPTNWTQAKDLTADRAALTLCRYHSTLLDICDVIPSGNSLYIKSQEFAAKASLLQQLQTLYDDLFAHIACDKQGRVYVDIDPQMKTLAERAGIAVVMDLQYGDWQAELQLPRPQEPKTGVINLAGVYFPGGDAEVVPLLSIAPGNAPGYTGGAREISGLILASQDDANVKSGLALAYDNNQFPNVSIPLSGLYDVFDIVPQEYVRLSLAASDTKRGIVWTNQKLIPRQVELNMEETEAGRVPKVDITVEKDSYGPAGVDGDYPSAVPEPEIALPPPPSGRECMADLIYFICGSHAFRTRNAMTIPESEIVYEDLGEVDPNPLIYIALDSWNPTNSAMMVAGNIYGAEGNSIYRTTNLDSDNPTWTKVLDLSTHDDTVAMVVSSIVQEGLWMCCGAQNQGQKGPWVRVSTDGGQTWTRRDLTKSGDTGTYPGTVIEVSAHDVNKAWVIFTEINSKNEIRYTTDRWATVLRATHPPGEWFVNSYHRYSNNPTDQHTVWVARAGAPVNLMQASACITDVGTCSTVTVSGVGVPILQGGYTWGENRYWILGYEGETNCLWVSNDAQVWIKQYMFTGVYWDGLTPINFISGWPFSAEIFFACCTGAVAPVSFSDDRGLTWWHLTGNWASVGLDDIVRQCVPIWVE